MGTSGASPKTYFKMWATIGNKIAIRRVVYDGSRIEKGCRECWELSKPKLVVTFGTQ